MVSKASDDFPLPLGPVTTVSFPSGRSRSMPLRLFWRAPRISTHPRAAPKAFGRAQFFSTAFEPTGDYSRMRCPSQILRAMRPAGLAETGRQLFALRVQFLWHDAA